MSSEAMTLFFGASIKVALTLNYIENSTKLLHVRSLY